MAGEEDVELRDLVAHTLETKGVLGKIRAQLRASVFLALEEQEAQQKPHPLVNSKFQQYLKTKDGQMATALVREFLSYFDLDYTCSVFDPETNALESYPGRDQLARDLGLDTSFASSSSGPLIASILHRATSITSTITPSTATSHPPLLSTTTASRAPQDKERHPTIEQQDTPPSQAAQANLESLVDGVFATSGLSAATTFTSTSLTNPWTKGGGGSFIGGGGGGSFIGGGGAGGGGAGSPSVGESGELAAKSQVATVPHHVAPSTNGIVGDSIGSSVGSGGGSPATASDAVGSGGHRRAGPNESGGGDTASPGKLSNGDEDDTDDFFNTKLPSSLDGFGTGTKDLKVNYDSYEEDFHSEISNSENSKDRSRSISHVKYEETEDCTVSENSFGTDIDFAEPAKT